MPITKHCVICGKEFQAHILWEMTRNTCSEECRYKLVSQKLSTKITLKCPVCGNEFQAQPSYKKVYCSKECRKSGMSKRFSGENNPCWKDTKTLRPSNKKSLRKHIQSRDTICQDCGKRSDLQVHHIDSNPNNNQDENLILLCKWCHANRHEEIGENNLVGLVLSNRTYSHREPRYCPICGKNFMPNKSEQVTCSPQCGKILSGKTRDGRTRTNRNQDRFPL